MRVLLPPVLVLLAGSAPSAPASSQAPTAAQERAARVEPDVLVELVRVIDGDTLEVEHEGRLETLRLYAVDTEEKISGRAALSPTKPETVFGEETAQWARRFFAELAPAGERPRIGLVFPEGEKRDPYGRLLAHVLLPDGRDFCLLLVEQGKSPYFTKYGNSLIRHADFVRAQQEARERELGIWNPRTNRATTSGAPSAVRPYARLLPWWDARAVAVDAFRAARAVEPERWVAADDAEALARAAERCAREPEASVVVFGTIARFFDEEDGSLTALFAAEGRAAAFRAQVARAARTDELERFLRESTQEFRQNYLFVEGRIERGARGFELDADGRGQWRLAGPEPELAPK